MKEIIGTHKIPKELIGADNPIILKWAREILLGQEPKLDRNDLKNIKEGKIIEIFLEPKIPGTYLPDGTFIKFQDYSPPLGGDLVEAEKIWDFQDKVDEWVEKENRLFNQETWKKSPNPIYEHWAHGKRIIEFCQAEKEINWRELCKKLEQRGGIEDYELMKHEWCVHLYHWKKELKEGDPVLSLNWKILSHILMFAKVDDSVKDYTLQQITTPPLCKLKSPDIALLLQSNLNRPEYQSRFSEEEINEILSLRKKIKSKETIEESEKERVVNIIKGKIHTGDKGKNG